MAITARQSQALHDLTTRGVLSADQESAVRDALEETGAPPRVADRVTELAAYVGGGLVLGGAALLLGLSWEDMSRLTRVGVLGAATVLLLVAAVAVGGRSVRAVTGVRRRVVSTLFSLAVVTAAFTAGTAVSSREFVVGATTGFVVAVAAYLLVPTALACLTLAAAAIATVIAWTTEYAADVPLVVGVALFALGLIGALLSLWTFCDRCRSRWRSVPRPRCSAPSNRWAATHG
ncbi:putative membrane protein DUF2157 [Lentzea atacamensis]|uniref:Putative membrane protein DUF2157 n=1 Tax=Lentzea atacamensis TaxID=531938 RepID=A0A316I243_9PSEU|nr:DUF2157 domain-containing protein [Lentzea atacamensis]PWK87205.1 putative membrane protein DUF2157 [Lentzea atacamensis]